jgi:hypothetical protein
VVSKQKASAQCHRIGFLGPDRISLGHSLLCALPAAGEVGHVLDAFHLMLKDIAAAHSRNPAVIQALAEVIAFCLVGPFQHHPVPGKKDGQCGQGHTAAAGAIHILEILINNSFTYALNHRPLLSTLYRGKLNNISRPISKAIALFWRYIQNGCMISIISAKMGSNGPFFNKKLQIKQTQLVVQINRSYWQNKNYIWN